MRLWIAGPRIFGLRTGVSFNLRAPRPARRSPTPFLLAVDAERGRVLLATGEALQARQPSARDNRLALRLWIVAGALWTGFASEVALNWLL